MAQQQILKWFQQRPWLLLPLLGLIPLAGLALNQHPEQPAPQASQTTTAPSPTASVPLPSAAKSPKPKASTSPKPIAVSPIPVNPATFTKEQAAINQRAKAAFAASAATVDSFIEMQIGIAIGVSSATIGSSAGADLIDEKGRSLHQLSAGKAYTAQAGGSGLDLGSWQLPALVWVEPAEGGVLYLGDKPYRGKFLLAAQKGRVWVVNYVNLRHYLSSVVASEVSPSWHMNALKAQSVAARSYALTYYFKPANSLYQMGADEYYQVYSGLAKEADRTQQAVDATAGEFVSYRGGIVESLYAASDDIVAEAFQGKGMSQLGALNLAEHGYSHHQILANYYPKTGVARIEQDHE
ncbi:SpoIID/LytB domain-containing protein [Phormidesmis priestleyi ULC007]|uniref:SpoIID/LytB domain-containing protein n=1 Tax=Phormidesmis priestleyi ULC007 TaxID=1920490 RepID=A0A2T1D9R9_9CYAN|nr:SpoIID/LytB domain-containing protein [Phormidesmis priestleyi]PSB17194.1 SpoIID/LytB domain-containing protein [Phormidesmis priestleyi ULC007]PZO47977.1 MAG: SpoIID/LytB domain-containing protein [Phormidesmis priestleyi]